MPAKMNVTSHISGHHNGRHSYRHKNESHKPYFLATVVAGTLLAITRQMLQLERDVQTLYGFRKSGSSESKKISVWVWSSLGGTSQVGVF